jgi:hypothetical protein
MSFGAYTKREAAKNPKPKFTRLYLQNGVPIPHDSVTAEQIDLLNRIVRPGHRADRKVEVVFLDNGKTVNLVYANKSIDQRLELGFRSFTDIVRPIVEEQEAEDLEEATNPNPSKLRRGGDGKFYAAR